ncbi:DNA topoisomerase 3 [Gorillibacterium sp. sgz500922]|uniref:type IA DNA topoisomerase n=1 Tax=Gorillibacterium sp. sgz500922 TaxID=3446694 RepID=UPI003F67A9AA
MKTLVIAEKPDMGRNIAAAIEPKAANRRTHLEGESYIITWAIGHLITLAEPDKYDDKYKKWRMADLPIIPDTFKLIPVYRTKDQLKVIAELAKQCGRIVNACDAGREGQLIFAYIQQHLKLRQPVDRLWISDLTAETIRRGFRELKSGADYDNLTRAARARSEADWLIGMNGSRAFTVRHNELLSVGRVQTPVLALIYDRQKQIEAFTSAKFYEVEAFFRQDEARYRGLWQGERIADPDKAKAIAAKVADKPGRIASYDIKETKEYPYKLYDLTLLQREANAKLGFSAKKTLDLAQGLYEKHKVISYPRTNSNYVTEENLPDMRKSLEMLKSTAYGELAAGADPARVHKNNKAVCNPAKVEDHHAILPTLKKPGALSPDEQKVYDLVVRRFLAQYYPPAEYKVHTVLTEAEGERFKTTVKELLAEGWKAIYAGEEAARKNRRNAKAKANEAGPDSDDPSAEEETSSPFVLDGARPVHCEEANAVEKETQPPKSYTEGTLLKAMESAGKQVEDEELRDAMKDSGLGTPATRAATIERLKQVGYIDMQGKKIAVTPKGRMAIELIRGAGVELLASPEMTGQWERRLNDIARGQADSAAFMEKVKQFARLIVDKVSRQAAADKTAFGETAGAGRPGGARGRGTGRGAAGGDTAARAAGTKRASARGGSGAAAKSAGRTGGASAAQAAAGSRRGSGGAPAPSAAAEVRARASAATSGSDSRASAAAPAAAGERPRVARCPRPGCGGELFMGRRGYGCSRYKEGCGFVIWKDSFGKSLSDSMVRQLAEKGRTGKLKFSDADGSFDGRLVLRDPATGALELHRAE